MTTRATFFDALDRRSFGGGDRAFEAAFLQAMRRDRIRAALGTPRAREVRALIGNVCAGRQSVVKRIARGGCRDGRALRRQIDYVTRDGTLAAWGNVAGVGLDVLRSEDVGAVVDSWTSGWRGVARHGHSEHILLSFPQDADPDLARRIAEDWGERLFGSGEFGDSWRYVAAFHTDRAHPHAHFIIEKQGLEQGLRLSIGRHGPFDYQLMRELHAEIAAEHGMEIHASTRQSRGLEAPAPADGEVRRAMREGSTVDPGLTGQLVDHGPARWNHDPAGSPSYFVTLEAKEGPRTLWGRDLARALETAGARAGDRIHLRRTGKEAVTLQGQGQGGIAVKRSLWEVVCLDASPEQMAQRASIAESYRALGEIALEAARQAEDPAEEGPLANLGSRLLVAASGLEQGEPVAVSDPISAQPVLGWIEAQADLIGRELQAAFTSISELPESPEKVALLERFALAVPEAAGVLQGYHDLEPYLTPPRPGVDLYALPELAALRDLADFEDAPEVARAMRLSRASLAERLAAELTEGDVPSAGIVGHLMEGRSLSAGQLGDRLRADASIWVAAHGEVPESAPEALLREAADWLIGRVELAQSWIADHPQAIPLEVYGWLAFHHRREMHDGQTLADINDRYAARLQGLSDAELSKLALGSPDALRGEIAIEDCRRALATDALAVNRDRLIALGHSDDEIRDAVHSLRTPTALRQAPEPEEKSDGPSGRSSRSSGTRRIAMELDDDDYSL